MTRPVPLAVDLDGTLTPADTLGMMVGRLVGSRPARIPAAAEALRGGKAAFKLFLWDAVGLEVGRLPWSATFLGWLREEAAHGRPLVLATGAPQALADAVAAHLGVFSAAIGTDAGCNLTGRRKAARLVAEYGSGGFDYAGNAAPDLAVWVHSRRAVVCNAPPAVAREAAAVARIDRRFDDRSRGRALAAQVIAGAAARMRPPAPGPRGAPR